MTTNGEALSIDLGAVTEPKMGVGFDKDNEIVTTVSFKVKADPRELTRIFAAGKRATLMARMFTLAPPELPDRQGDQLPLGAATPPEPPAESSA